MKGIFYSTITVLFVLPMLFFASVYLDSLKTSGEGAIAKAVGDKLLSFSRSVDSDLPRAMDIIVKRSVGANVDYIEVHGQPLDNAKSRIAESMINGTVFGNSTNLNNFTITIWANIISMKGSSYGLASNVSVISTDITPLDSYHIGVGMVISANISEPKSETSLYRIYNTTIAVSIEGQIDPLYLLNTNGLLKRAIQAPNITVYGAANVDSAVARAYYMQSDAGPTFFDRLEGRLSNSYNQTGIGLEAFVYLPELQANGLPVKTDQSSIDYIYFNPSSITGQAVNGSAYNWLRLNSQQAAKYGVTLI